MDGSMVNVIMIEALIAPPNDPDRNELQYFAQGEPALQALR